MTFLGFDLDSASYFVNVLAIVVGLVLAALTGLAFHLNNRVTDAKDAEVARLKESVRGRHLSESQRTGLLALLAASAHKGKVDIQCAMSDDEACKFGQELHAVLAEAGWTPNFIFAAMLVNFEGVQVQQTKEGAALPMLVDVLAALSAQVTNVSTGADGTVGEGIIRLLIGRKPKQ